jgi:predicted acylesterase/phospholipase RssA
MPEDVATKRAIVLSGGGALGAFEAGVIASLAKRTTFDIVCGTSIGAINAAFVAQGAFDELAQLWKTIPTMNILRYVEQVEKVSSFIDDLEGLRGKPEAAFGNVHLLNDWFKIGSKKALLALRGAYDPSPIEDLLKPILSTDKLKSTLVVSTTNLTNATSDAFYYFVNATNDDIQRFKAFRVPDPSYPISNDNYISAVKASMSIPGAFEPVDMNLGQGGVRHDYVDGGVTNNTPISLAIAAGATEVYVVFLNPTPSVQAISATNSLSDIAMASFAVMQQRILELDMRLATQSKATIKVVRPTKPIEVSVLDFNNEPGIASAYDDGLQAGSAT